jgi:hypothetical protein
VRRLGALVVLSAALATSASLAGGCYGPTAVRVVLGTNLPCPDRITSLYVGRPGDRVSDPQAVTDRCGAPGAENIGDVVLVPSGDRDDRVLVEVISAPRGKAPESCRDDARDCVIARRLVSYRRHETRPLPVFLSDRCLGIPCGADQTCVDGRCDTADVDSTAFCAETGCDGGAPDASAADAQPPIDPSRPCAGGERVLATGVDLPSGVMRAGPTHLYWRTAQGIVSMPKTGGVAAVIPERFDAVAVTPDGLYLGSASALARRSLDGVATVWTQPSNVTALAASAIAVYYTDGAEVFGRPVATGGTPSLLPMGPATALAATASAVYSANGTTVARVDPDGTKQSSFRTPTTIQDLLANSKGVAALSMGAVTFVGLANVLLDLEAEPGRLLFYMALDETYVYASSTLTAPAAPGVVLYYRIPSGLGTGANAWSSLPPYDGVIGAIASDGECLYVARTPRGSSTEIVATPVP